jgi:CDP-diglyceride synthetase
MLKRTLTSLAFAAVGLPAIIFGGVFYYLLMAVILTGSAWEYVRLYRAVRYEPSEIVTVGGVLVIATARFAVTYFHLVDIALPLLYCSSRLPWLCYCPERGRIRLP